MFGRTSSSSSARFASQTAAQPRFSFEEEPFISSSGARQQGKEDVIDVGRDYKGQLELFPTAGFVAAPLHSPANVAYSTPLAAEFSYQRLDSETNTTLGGNQRKGEKSENKLGAPQQSLLSRAPSSVSIPNTNPLAPQGEIGLGGGLYTSSRPPSVFGEAARSATPLVASGTDSAYHGVPDDHHRQEENERPIGFSASAALVGRPTAAVATVSSSLGLVPSLPHSREKDATLSGPSAPAFAFKEGLRTETKPSEELKTHESTSPQDHQQRHELEQRSEVEPYTAPTARWRGNVLKVGVRHQPYAKPIAKAHPREIVVSEDGNLYVCLPPPTAQKEGNALVGEDQRARDKEDGTHSGVTRAISLLTIEEIIVYEPQPTYKMPDGFLELMSESAAVPPARRTRYHKGLLSLVAEYFPESWVCKVTPEGEGASGSGGGGGGVPLPLWLVFPSETDGEVFVESIFNDVRAITASFSAAVADVGEDLAVQATALEPRFVELIKQRLASPLAVRVAERLRIDELDAIANALASTNNKTPVKKPSNYDEHTNDGTNSRDVGSTNDGDGGGGGTPPPAMPPPRSALTTISPMEGRENETVAPSVASSSSLILDSRVRGEHSPPSAPPIAGSRPRSPHSPHKSSPNKNNDNNNNSNNKYKNSNHYYEDNKKESGERYGEERARPLPPIPREEGSASPTSGRAVHSDGGGGGHYFLNENTTESSHDYGQQANEGQYRGREEGLHTQSYYRSLAAGGQSYTHRDAITKNTTRAATSADGGGGGRGISEEELLALHQEINALRRQQVEATVAQQRREEHWETQLRRQEEVFAGLLLERDREMEKEREGVGAGGRGVLSTSLAQQDRSSSFHYGSTVLAPPNRNPLRDDAFLKNLAENAPSPQLAVVTDLLNATRNRLKEAEESLKSEKELVAEAHAENRLLRKEIADLENGAIAQLQEENASLRRAKEEELAAVRTAFKEYDSQVHAYVTDLKTKHAAAVGQLKGKLQTSQVRSRQLRQYLQRLEASIAQGGGGMGSGGGHLGFLNDVEDDFWGDDDGIDAVDSEGNSVRVPRTPLAKYRLQILGASTAGGGVTNTSTTSVNTAAPPPPPPSSFAHHSNGNNNDLDALTRSFVEAIRNTPTKATSSILRMPPFSSSASFSGAAASSLGSARVATHSTTATATPQNSGDPADAAVHGLLSKLEQLIELKAKDAVVQLKARQEQSHFEHLQLSLIEEGKRAAVERSLADHRKRKQQQQQQYEQELEQHGGGHDDGSSGQHKARRGRAASSVSATSSNGMIPEDNAEERSGLGGQEDEWTQKMQRQRLLLKEQCADDETVVEVDVSDREFEAKYNRPRTTLVIQKRGSGGFNTILKSTPWDDDEEDAAVGADDDNYEAEAGDDRPSRAAALATELHRQPLLSRGAGDGISAKPKAHIQGNTRIISLSGGGGSAAGKRSGSSNTSRSAVLNGSTATITSTRGTPIRRGQLGAGVLQSYHQQATVTRARSPSVSAPATSRRPSTFAVSSTTRPRAPSREPTVTEYPLPSGGGKKSPSSSLYKRPMSPSASRRLRANSSVQLNGTSVYPPPSLGTPKTNEASPVRRPFSESPPLNNNDRHHMYADDSGASRARDVGSLTNASTYSSSAAQARAERLQHLATRALRSGGRGLQREQEGKPLLSHNERNTSVQHVPQQLTSETNLRPRPQQPHESDLVSSRSGTPLGGGVGNGRGGLGSVSGDANSVHLGTARYVSVMNGLRSDTLISGPAGRDRSIL